MLHYQANDTFLTDMLQELPETRLENGTQFSPLRPSAQDFLSLLHSGMSCVAQGSRYEIDN